ncbi:hypothetical protein, variant 2 [Aphanomyces astaci]|nr:hypothetical protein, variant 2 [Aphanomyces astaci]ETV84374.1 hypothetical protein, variant 2 [Aphanomyces astaci]|eukprot:XP_009826066.1 hypothetical protein, variant 2 [Aphanomyces astaci]
MRSAKEVATCHAFGRCAEFSYPNEAAPPSLAIPRLKTDMDVKTSSSGELGWLQPHHEDGLWWPVHVHGRNKFTSPPPRDVIDSPTTPEEAAGTYCEVYSFGTYKVSTHPAKSIQPWSAMQPVRSSWRLGRHANVYRQALVEVESFLNHTKPSANERDEDESPPIKPDGKHNDDDDNDAIFAANSIVWAKLRGYPWLPAYVVDVHQYDLTRAHRVPRDGGVVTILQQAQRDRNLRVVYYFQSHNFGLHKATDQSLQPWMGDKHDLYANPKPPRQGRTVRRRHKEQLCVALREVADLRAKNQTLHELPCTLVLRKLCRHRRNHDVAPPKAVGNAAFNDQDTPSSQPPFFGSKTEILNRFAWMNRATWLPWMPVFVFDPKTTPSLRSTSDTSGANRADGDAEKLEMTLHKGECAVFDFSSRSV